MEIVKRTQKVDLCGGICFNDNSKDNYFILTDFMLGDADDYKTTSQSSFKKLNKNIKNLILALEVMPRDIQDRWDYFLNDEIDTPYSESSYWIYEGYEVIYVDKDMKAYNCTVNFDKGEQTFIDSENYEEDK